MKSKIRFLLPIALTLSFITTACAGDNTYLGNEDVPVFVQFPDGVAVQGADGAAGPAGADGAPGSLANNQIMVADNWIAGYNNSTGVWTISQPAVANISGLQTALDAKEDEANKAAAGGYASLDGTTKVPTAQLGTGTANSTTYLRGDRSWVSVVASAAWGAITGTLSDQTDLQNALDAKENTANKSNDNNLGTSAALYPTQNATKVYVDTQVATKLSTANVTTAPTAGAVLAMDANGRVDSGVTRMVEVMSIADATTLTTGNGTFGSIVFSSELNGFNLVDVDASLGDAQSTSGTPTINIYNVTDGEDVLSTDITIDINEWSSFTAATPPVINASFDDVVTGARWRIDVSVAGTGAKGLHVILIFRKP